MPTGPMQTQTTNTAPTNQPAGLPPLQQPAAGSTWAGNQPGATTWQAPGGTATSAVGGPDQFGGNYEQWFRALVGNRPWNQETLNNLMPVLEKYGIRLTPPNAAGDQTKIGLPDGSWVRVGFGEGHPVWIPQTNAGGAGGAQGPNSPWAIPPPFQSPSAADLQNEPGYQARYQMGADALQHSAAAQGSLLSGGFQKALARYGQDYASNEYSNAYNRAYQNYAQNYNIQSVAPWNRYQQVLDRGVQSANILANAGKVPPQSS